VRFLILTQYFAPEPGAAQARLAAFARQLVRAGHQVEVVAAMPNYPQGRIVDSYRHQFYRRERWEGITVHRLWLYASQGAGLGRMLNYATFTLTSLVGLAKSRRPDYLFVESPPLFLSIPGFLAARLWRVPWIFNVSDLWPDSVADLNILRSGWMLRAAFALEAWAYRRASYISAVTWGIHQQLENEKGVPQHKLLFLPNGVDIDLFKPLPADKALLTCLGLEGKQVVIFPGTQGYAHGMESVLRTAEKLRHHENIHFLLVGSGSAKQQLEADAQRLELRNMTFLDPVPPEQIPQLISTAACGLASQRNIPLLREARSVKALTVMSCGKPLVFAVGRDAGSFVKEAQCGLVVSVEEPDAIADAILWLLDHPAEAAQFGRNGRDYVCRNLQWPALVGSWLQQLPSPLLPHTGNKIYEYADPSNSSQLAVPSASSRTRRN
jgi:colanic acid biosynthesis glycosyl transferase WcaI